MRKVRGGVGAMCAGAISLFVTLAPSTVSGKSSGLTFHYPPYAVGSYVEGEYIAFVPWETLKPFLSPEGAKIFGGARPKDDDDGTR